MNLISCDNCGADLDIDVPVVEFDKDRKEAIIKCLCKCLEVSYE